MKYIRTKDGRILKWLPNGCVKENNGMVSCFGFFPDYNDYYLEETIKIIKEYFHTEIVKYTDNLEDLIDGLIVEDKNDNSNWFIMETMGFMITPIKERKYMGKSWNYIAYIKTDKGLIYKAKMNKEGKLELL